MSHLVSTYAWENYNWETHKPQVILSWGRASMLGLRRTVKSVDIKVTVEERMAITDNYKPIRSVGDNEVDMWEHSRL